MNVLLHRRHLGGDLSWQVAEHDEDGALEQGRAEHRVGMSGDDEGHEDGDDGGNSFIFCFPNPSTVMMMIKMLTMILVMVRTRRMMLMPSNSNSQGNNNNHTQPVVNRLTLLLNCELFPFTFFSHYLLPLNTSADLKQ